MFPFLVVVINVFVLFLLLMLTRQEIIHWIILVVIRVRVSKYDVDYGVSLDLPYASDEKATSYI